MKISSANSGRCSVSHALSAIASRVSLLEWLKKIRDTYVYPPFVEAPESPRAGLPPFQCRERKDNPAQRLGVVNGLKRVE